MMKQTHNVGWRGLWKTALGSLAWALLGSVALAAPVSFGGSYTENFNSMGTGTAAPAGWSVYSISGSHDQFKPADDLVGAGCLAACGVFTEALSGLWFE
jgi:hypothetical protein